MKTEHHIAGRITIKGFSTSSRGAGLTNTDIGSDDRWRNTTSNIIIPSYFLPRMIPWRSRLTSSRPDTVAVTPYHAKPNSPPPPSCSHRVLRSRRRSKQRTTTANRVRQPTKYKAVTRALD
eukprot:1142924-Pelagomonas_calceolata.AAC.1